MKRNALLLVGITLAVALLIYAAARMSRLPADADSMFAAKTAVVKGSVAPDFELTTLDGKTLKLSDYRGRAVLLNFWATWCGPCKIEMPWFVELNQKYASQGLTILGVAMDDSGQAEIARFAKEMGVNYPILIGKEKVGDAYGGVPGLPTTFYIDRNGKILDRVVGIVGRSEIEAQIQKALATGQGIATSAPAAKSGASKP
jgi:thiol-disulfide isomerase/thioredoxin